MARPGAALGLRTQVAASFCERREQLPRSRDPEDQPFSFSGDGPQREGLSRLPRRVYVTSQHTQTRNPPRVERLFAYRDGE